VHGIQALLQVVAAQEGTRGQRFHLDRLVDEGTDDRARIRLLEQPIPVGVAASRRRGVEHYGAADGRLGAQHHPVSSRGDDGRGETELRVTVADPHDPCGDPARPVVHREAGTVGDRLQLVERHLEPVRARERIGGDQRVAAVHLLALDSGQAHRHPLASRRALDRDVVHLHGAHSHVAAPRLEPELVAGADRPRPEGPGGHRPDPAQREGPVDVKPGREVGPALLGRGRHLGERGPQLFEPRAGHAADRHDGRAGHELS
jgi:hypothetical protein